MSKYSDLLQDGSLPEFINFEQAANVADCLSNKRIQMLIDGCFVESIELDNGEIAIDTVSLLEYMEKLDNNYIRDCQDDRLNYLKALKESKEQ